MIEIHTKDAIKELKHLTDKLSHKEVMIAQSRAINHTLGVARTTLSRIIREVYKIPVAVANKSLHIKRSNPTSPVGFIKASSYRTPLAAFQPTFTSQSGVRTIVTKQGYAASKVGRVKRVRTTAMQIEIVRGKKTTMRGAFLIPGMSKAVVAGRGKYAENKDFQWRNKRVNKEGSDTPIDSLTTVSVFKAITTRSQQGKVAVDLSPRYRDRLIHEMSRTISTL
jgi:hypothetical protein